jgi:hypothetical protein
MTKLNAFFIAIALSFGLLVRCNSNMSAECAEFYALPKSQQEIVFKSYPLEKQFELYRCGMRREPPDMGLALPIADNGEKAIPLLLEKLKREKEEPTQSHIIDIFEAMSRRGHLNERRDVVENIRQIVAAMKSTFFREMGQRSLENIEKNL